jgi:hypothetical protein
MTDNDRDVSQAARAVHDAFKRTPLRMGGGGGAAGGLLDIGGGGRLGAGGGAGAAAAPGAAGGVCGGAAAFGPGPAWDPELSDRAREDGEADMVFCQVGSGGGGGRGRALGERGRGRRRLRAPRGGCRVSSWLPGAAGEGPRRRFSARAAPWLCSLRM